MIIDAQPDRRRNFKAIRYAGILIVQPDATIARTWCDALAQFGMSCVRAAVSADAAIELVATFRPQGILIALPSLSEAEGLLNRLGGEDGIELDGVPVILAIECSSRHVMHVARRAGFVAVLTLPLAPRLIYRHLGSLMQKARRSSRLRSRKCPPAPAEALMG